MPVCCSFMSALSSVCRPGRWPQSFNLMSNALSGLSVMCDWILLACCGCKLVCEAPSLFIPAMPLASRKSMEAFRIDLSIAEICSGAVTVTRREVLGGFSREDPARN